MANHDWTQRAKSGATPPSLMECFDEARTYLMGEIGIDADVHPENGEHFAEQVDPALLAFVSLCRERAKGERLEGPAMPAYNEYKNLLSDHIGTLVVDPHKESRAERLRFSSEALRADAPRLVNALEALVNNMVRQNMPDGPGSGAQK